MDGVPSIPPKHSRRSQVSFPASQPAERSHGPQKASVLLQRAPSSIRFTAFGRMARCPRRPMAVATWSDPRAPFHLDGPKAPRSSPGSHRRPPARKQRARARDVRLDPLFAGRVPKAAIFGPPISCVLRRSSTHTVRSRNTRCPEEDEPGFLIPRLAGFRPTRAFAISIAIPCVARSLELVTRRRGCTSASKRGFRATDRPSAVRFLGRKQHEST